MLVLDSRWHFGSTWLSVTKRVGSLPAVARTHNNLTTHDPKADAAGSDAHLFHALRTALPYRSEFEEKDCR